MTVAGLHRILLVSDVGLGAWLTTLLKADDRELDVVESYGRHDAMYDRLSRQGYDVVLLSNTTLTPKHILEVIPEIRLRFPSVSIVVLSGWMEADFASSLERLNIHDVFKTPGGTQDAVRRIAEILGGKNVEPPGAITRRVGERMHERARVQLLERIEGTRAVYEAARASRDAELAANDATDADGASFRANLIAADARAARNAARAEHAAIDATYTAGCEAYRGVYEKDLEYSRTFLLHRTARARAARIAYDATLAALLAIREANRNARATYDSEYDATLAAALSEYDAERACARADFADARARYDAARAAARSNFIAALHAASGADNAPRNAYEFGNPSYNSVVAIIRACYDTDRASARADFDAARVRYDAARATARASFEATLAAVTCEAAYDSVRATCEAQLAAAGFQAGFTYDHDYAGPAAERAAEREESRCSRTAAYAEYSEVADYCDASRATSKTDNDDALAAARDEYDFARTIYSDALANYGADYDSARIAALAVADRICAGVNGEFEASLVKYVSACEVAGAAFCAAQTACDAVSAKFRTLLDAARAKHTSALDAAQAAAVRDTVSDSATVRSELGAAFAAAYDSYANDADRASALAACREKDVLRAKAQAKYESANEECRAARVRGLISVRATCEAARADYHAAITLAGHAHTVALEKNV